MRLAINDFSINIDAALPLLLHLQLYKVVLLNCLSQLRVREVGVELQAIHLPAIGTAYLRKVLREES